MLSRLSWSIFWALVATFTVIVSWFFVAATNEFARGFPFLVFLASSGFVFFSLGITLIVITVKEKVGGRLSKFLILTGAAATGIPVSIILHNAIYGLFIHWFGTDFWDRIGLGDEPFFFVMAIFICPVAFLVGTVGSIVLAIKRGRKTT